MPVKFYPDSWSRDVRDLSLEAKGAWIEILCALWKAGQAGTLIAEVGVWTGIIGAKSDQQTLTVLEELTDKGIANITMGGGSVTLISRRLARERVKRDGGKKRAKNWREKKARNATSNADVTPPILRRENQSRNADVTPPVTPPEILTLTVEGFETLQKPQKEKQEYKENKEIPPITPKETKEKQEVKEKKEKNIRQLTRKESPETPLLLPKPDPLAKPPKPYPQREDLPPLAKVICAWKEITGYAYDDRDWDKAFWARFARPAKLILDFMGGEFEKAIKCCEDIKKRMEKERLSYTLDTVIKHMAEWRLKHGRN